jgi:hypothetical protein
VNTYKNVFFASYIYKPVTSSHSKPELFGTATLTLLLTGSWIFPLETSELDFRRIPELTILRNSWLHWFEIPEDCMSASPKLRRFEIPEDRTFATLSLRRFEIPENHKCLAPGKHISRTSLNSTFRGWRFSWIPQQLGHGDGSCIGTTVCVSMVSLSLGGLAAGASHLDS